MKRVTLFLGPFLILILGAASQSAGAQAAVEYGLTSASSGTSTSALAKVYSHRLEEQTASRKIDRTGATTPTHNTPPAGSKVQTTNRKTGRSTVAAVTGQEPKQPGRVADVPPAAGISLKIYGSAPADAVRR